MDKIVVQGLSPLGEVSLTVSKNAALAVLVGAALEMNPATLIMYRITQIYTI